MSELIYQELSAVMRDCKAVAKRDRNEHQRFLFRGIDAVVNAVGPILRDHAVIVAPQVRTVEYDVVQTSTGKPATACRILADYVFMASDGSHITTTVAAEAWDSGDKAAPKAMSIAFRTALLQALCLPTDEPEPDSQTYERSHAPTQRRQRSAPRADTGELIDPTSKLMQALQASFRDLGMGRDTALAYCAQVTGRAVESTKELTKGEASRVIDALKADTAETVDPTVEPGFGAS